jgi:hypothetical protein
MARVQLTRPLMWAGVAYAKGDTLNGLTTDEAIGLVSRGHGVDLDGVATKWFAPSERYDVVVYGATPSGCVAAMTAARAGKVVLLIDPEDKIGGMMGGGLSWTDVKISVNRSSIGAGVVDELFRRAAAYYGQSPQAFYESNCNAEPRVFRLIFEKMLAQHRVLVYKNSPVQSVDKNGTTIRSVVFENIGCIAGKVWIDCSYEQDLMALSGVTHVIGREAAATYGEGNAGVRTPSTTIIPAGVDPYITPGVPSSGVIYGVSPDPVASAGSADGKVQAFVYRLCLKNGATDQVPFPAPSNYDASKYELAARLFAVTNPTSINDIFTLQQIKGSNKYDANNSGGFSINYVSPECSEYITASWERRRQIRENARQHILGFWYFLNNDPRVPGALKTSISAWGLSAEEFLSTAGFSDVFYVRESRRMVGDYVFTQADLSLTATLADEIAFGYYDADSHTVQRVIVSGNVRAEGNILTSTTAGYRIPYRILCPKAAECTNLLSTFGASASRVAFLSLRMEPKLMVLGAAAGAAACIAAEDNVAVQSVSTSKLLQLHDLWGVYSGVVLNTAGEYANGTVTQAGGSWSTTNSVFGYLGANALHDQNTGKGKTLTFAPNIPSTGLYQVYFKYPSNTAATRAQNVPVTINHAGGTASVTVDQAYTTGGGGHWEDLGAYVFRKGAPSADTIVIGTAGTSQTVVASAVKFVKVTP